MKWILFLVLSSSSALIHSQVFEIAWNIEVYFRFMNKFLKCTAFSDLFSRFSCMSLCTRCPYFPIWCSSSNHFGYSFLQNFCHYCTLELYNWSQALAVLQNYCYWVRPSKTNIYLFFHSDDLFTAVMWSASLNTSTYMFVCGFIMPQLPNVAFNVITFHI